MDTSDIPITNGTDMNTYLITRARKHLDNFVGDDNLILLQILLTLYKHQYTIDRIIEDLRKLFNKENILQEPDNIKRFKIKDKFDIHIIKEETKAHTCTNREILYCIQQIICK